MTQYIWIIGILTIGAVMVCLAAWHDNCPSRLRRTLVVLSVLAFLGWFAIAGLLGGAS